MKKLKTISRHILGIFFIIAGIAHFVMPGFYLRMIPDYLPAPLFLVYFSALAEIILGIMALLPRYLLIAKWGLISLLAAIFPANMHMALNPALFPEFPEYGLWLRLPFQIIFIVWVLFSLQGSNAAQKAPANGDF